jgi:hypothetical protein
MHSYMRVARPAWPKIARVRAFVYFALAAVLVSSCVVYTPDLLNEDNAVSLGGGSKPTPAPGAAVPSASGARLPAAANPSPDPQLRNEPRAQLEREKLAPDLRGAIPDAATTDWFVASDAAPDAAPDAGSP